MSTDVYVASEVVDVLRYGFLPKERVFYFTLSQAA